VEIRDMEMTPDTIRALLDAFDRSDWREMTVTIGADRLHVSRDEPQLSNGAGPTAAVPIPAVESASGQAGERASGQVPEPAAAPPTAAEPAPAAAPTATANGTVIEAPSVGLFWRAPAPGAPPFVEVGSQVKAGDTLAIVEVMKLMNHVVSPVDGVVAEILVENGAPVEFGQAIVTVEPEA
jgi:acetyl-CoA carboxylase biotin carboxyl carrier protein